ncbi:hypothetical protein KIH39_22035 [Telmatocola sphagniphila]|uniref:Uncharacterized protein n=1 Tax=Telmatocola sphagniphila TaxID=1123043 RepID=A0A8E6B3X5_9BACT|nr:hypothetical protein [Telmatocola sphagniphila]QVL31498.1 hypothetical protein KIH39_22035 [Telmatocola sphagniphila]
MKKSLVLMTLLFFGSFARAQEPVLGSNSLSGSWTGTWLSTDSGHKGPLKAELIDQGNGAYQAKFRGRFFAVIPFRYNVTLNVVQQNGNQTTLAGSSRLPFFGTFQYSAVSDGQSLNAEYTSRSDHGQFQLRRR